MIRLKNWLLEHRILGVSMVAGAVLSALILNFTMNLFEAYLYDLRVRTSGTAKKESLHTVIVTIDDEAIERLNEYAPLSLKTHTSLMRLIGQSHPKAIAYFIDFNDTVVTQEKTSQKVSDADQFVTQAETLTKSGIPVFLGTDVDVSGEVVPPFPLSKLTHKVALIHKDGTTFSEDKVTRRALFSIYDEPTLHVHLASLLNGTTKSEHYQGVYNIPEINARYFMINYAGKTQEKKHPFPEYSALDILDGKVPASTLEGKIVLIGTKSKENSTDYVYSPYSRSIFLNPKIVVHANILETLIKNNAIMRAPKKVDIALTFILTTLIIAIVLSTTPLRGVIATFIGSTILLLFGFLIFDTLNLSLYLSHPLVGVIAAYYVFVPYRLIMEYKQRWNIQKKHEVLVQVEELKSNFMSLITHDLKTPVARIQGMGEILQSSGADPKIVKEILGSTDELNNFISSILELAKIESNRVKIFRHSKDVNKIIEDCARKLEFSAVKRGITIKLDLEPMFPIMIDASLVTKVISNLIDNAVKYSPDGTHVTVTSRESVLKPGFVEIKISDDGYGISSKDVENLFTKFYRPKNDLTMKIKGTGLGLYLSRYFVELHDGTLTVESSEGKGSTFTILMPIEDTQSQTANDTIVAGARSFFAGLNQKFFGKKNSEKKSINQQNDLGGNSHV